MWNSIAKDKETLSKIIKKYWCVWIYSGIANFKNLAIPFFSKSLNERPSRKIASITALSNCRLYLVETNLAFL